MVCKKHTNVISGQELESAQIVGSFLLQFPNGVENELTNVCREAPEGVKEEAVTELDAVIHQVLNASSTRCRLFPKSRPPPTETDHLWQERFTHETFPGYNSLVTLVGIVRAAQGGGEE